MNSPVALRGNLKDFGIADVFQLIGQQRKTGRLEVQGDQKSVVLAFDAGAVVWASPDSPSALGRLLVQCGWVDPARLSRVDRESRRSARSLAAILIDRGDVSAVQVEEAINLLTGETIFDVLRWGRGTFHFKAQAVEHDRPREALLGSEQILMEGLRMIDEWPSLKQLVPSEETVFRRVSREEKPLDSKGWGLVLSLVNGRSSVRRVVDLSRLGTFEGTRVLAELRSAGWIEPIERAGKVSAHESLGGITAPIMQVARFVGLSILPLALLAGVAVLALERSPARESVSGAWIRQAPLEAAQAGFARRRVQNALEASRYLTGRPVADPADAVSWSAIDQLALTPDNAGDYYFVSKNDEVILLAPER